MHVRLAEIEVMRSTLDESIIGVFRYDQDARERRGSLVLFVEITATQYIYERLLDVINTSIEQARYLVSAIDTDPMARFEKIVERVNNSVAQFAEQEGSQISWNRLNLFLLQYGDEHLCFSGIGQVMNIFLQRQADESYRSFDLFGSLEQLPQPDPAKLFSSLVCGDIHVGDMLFIGTLNFQRLREQLRLKERLLGHAPVAAATDIREAIEETDIPDDFVAILLAAVTAPAPIATETPSEDTSENGENSPSTASVQEMYDTEQFLQEALEPTLLPSSGRSQKTKKDPHPTLVERTKQWAAEHIERSSSVIAQSLSVTSLRGMHAGHGKRVNPEKQKKTALAIGGALLIIGLIFGAQRYRVTRAESALWNSVYDQATEKRDRAEASLVATNEDRARKEVTEAFQLVNGLNQSTDERKASKDKLLASLEQIRSRLRKERRVDQPSMLFEDASIPENALSGLVLLGNAVYTVRADTNTILKIDTSSKAVTPIPGPADTSLRLVGNGQTSPIFLSNDLGLFDLRNGAVRELTFTAKKASSTEAVVGYGSRLYTLDPVGNMIWRYSSNGNGFGGEAKYVADGTPSLAAAKTIAIDSSLYVGFSTGEIRKYTAGTQDTWSPTRVDPAFKNVTHLWTEADSPVIAVLDQSNKRLVLLEKNGAVREQILSSAFVAPKAVWGNIAKKQLYVLDGRRILTFDFSS